MCKHGLSDPQCCSLCKGQEQSPVETLSGPPGWIQSSPTSKRRQEREEREAKQVGKEVEVTRQKKKVWNGIRRKGR